VVIHDGKTHDGAPYFQKPDSEPMTNFHLAWLC
jgi:hypothetical protein